MKEVECVKPKYQIIIDDIKSNILSGTYSVGEQIPTESALQDSYTVSRQTVRKAILELSNEGFLRSEKGSGTYVSNLYRSRTGGNTMKKQSALSRHTSPITSSLPLSAALKAG